MYKVHNDTNRGKLTINNDNNVIAFLDYIFRSEEKTLELLRMFVNFDYRGKNYSIILIKEIINYANKIRAKFITLNIDPEIEDCYITLANDYGFESNYYDALVDMDEKEQRKFFEKAKKLQEKRKSYLTSLFENFGFTEWDEEINGNLKKKTNTITKWFILRL